MKQLHPLLHVALAFGLSAAVVRPAHSQAAGAATAAVAPAAATIAAGAAAAGPQATAVTDDIAGRKTYEVRYMANAPYGVSAWAASELVRDAGRRESRFVGYNSEAARNLILDATAERGVELDPGAAARETAFYSVYDDKGWYVYIEATEPLIQELLDNVVDPASPARREGYEIFFTPGLHGVPYYQIFTKPFAGSTSLFDWGVPHRGYRSLKDHAKVESLPLAKGYGTFLFIPWDRLYDRLPLRGDLWRFSVIRWMPYGKAGGVTWGGQVHDTGNMGLLRFQPPTTEQETAVRKRVLRTAWFKYLATARAATAFWNDDKLGDLKFYTERLKPVIDANTSLGESLGKPDTWTAETLKTAGPALADWMEFGYKISELRSAYLLEKQMTTP